MAGNSVTKSNRKNGTVERHADVAHWIGQLRLSAEVGDDEEFNPDDIIAAMLNADSFEAALAAQESGILSGKQIVGVPHTIEEFKIKESDEKYKNSSSLGHFAVVSGKRLDTGEKLVYAVGAANVLAILWQAGRFGKIPGDFVIASRETSNGEMLMLKPVKAHTVQGTTE